MIGKSVVTGLAAFATIGAAAAGVTSLATTSHPGLPVKPVVFSAPLDQTTTLPTADQLSGVLNGLADPNVPFANKSGLVEGGISGNQAAMGDHEIKKAAKKGELPLAFTVSNIAPAAGNGATAAVGISGPKIQPPVTQTLTFVNQGGWMLSRDSAMTLIQAATGN
jgi:hypothetical protein